MNRRKALEPSRMNPHARAFIENTATVILSFVAVLALCWVAGL